MQRWVEFALGMTTWATEASPNLYIDPPWFKPRYQRFYDDHIDHMLVKNLRERFSTSAAMETYFSKQDQALANRRAEMRAT